MKRTVTLLAVLSVMAACLSGCILSAEPDTSANVTLKVGQAQTFKVSGFFNNAYTWTKNGATVATGESYTYTALAEDAGQFTIEVRTTELFSTAVISKTWLVEVTDDLPPVAVAGEDQNITPGTFVQLNGGASYDPEGKAVTYLWEIVQRPEGSTATLSSETIVNPTFTADEAGSYTVRLIVNDGTSNSPADSVIIQAYFSGSTPPTAEAGDDQTVNYGETVELDGSGSSDPEHDPLTYQWKIETQPAGGAAVLSSETSEKPNFTPNKSGQYTLSLVVNDGLYNSNVDWVTITVQNTAPEANAGGDITIGDLGGTATLDGSGSGDPEDNPLTYAWTVTSRPNGSTAVIVDSTSETATFTPDKKGEYWIKLEVSDGELSDVATIKVKYSNHVPTAEAGDDITIAFGGSTQLNGSGTDPDGDQITYAWTFTQKPTGSTATLSSATIANPYFTPDKKGTYKFQLTVTDDEGLSSVDTMTLTTTNHAPVANAGSDVDILNMHLVQLSGSGTDADGDPLTYAWTVVTAPTGSTATFSNPAIANPTFTPDRKGTYTLGFVVYDGEDSSMQDTLQIIATNNTPVVDAGADLTAVHFANRIVQLDGSGSSDLDPEDTLHYAWNITLKPTGSTATIVNSTLVNPVITLDVPGTYVISLVVDDGTLDSTVDTVTLTTSAAVTYTTGWENGPYDSNGVAWDLTSSNGSINEITDDYSHNGSYSLWQRSCEGDCEGGGYAKTTNYAGAYVISVTYWAYTNFWLHFPYHEAGLWEGDTLRVSYTGENSWTQYSWSPNRVVTDLTFRLNNPGYQLSRGNMSIDDISVTVWD